MTALPPDSSAARGVLRLLNTAGGRVLCLAGTVDEEVVQAFLRRYGPEPAVVDGVDAGSLTWLSAPGRDLVLAHVTAAGRAGRPVTVHRSPWLERLLAEAGAHVSPPSGPHP